MKSDTEALQRLVDIVDELREKCPWDKIQTFDTLRYLTIEEVYELSEAIVQQKDNDIKKELGDLFMHLVFYASIAKENGLFSLADAINSVCDKLIFRHPHIYGTATESPSWEKIKLKETDRKSVLDGVPNSLPAMLKSLRMQEKTAGVGFEWQNSQQALDKVYEEYKELNIELQKVDNQQNIEEEFGDLLFAIVGWARQIGINPENALEKANQKFKKRFQNMEQQASDKNISIANMDTSQLIEWWRIAKKNTDN